MTFIIIFSWDKTVVSSCGVQAWESLAKAAKLVHHYWLLIDKSYNGTWSENTIHNEVLKSIAFTRSHSLFIISVPPRIVCLFLWLSTRQATSDTDTSMMRRVWVQTKTKRREGVSVQTRAMARNKMADNAREPGTHTLGGSPVIYSRSSLTNQWHLAPPPNHPPLIHPPSMKVSFTRSLATLFLVTSYSRNRLSPFRVRALWQWYHFLGMQDCFTSPENVCWRRKPLR